MKNILPTPPLPPNTRALFPRELELEFNVFIIPFQAVNPIYGSAVDSSCVNAIGFNDI